MVPDNNTPSWGVGIIYHHVKALNEGGFEAFLVHEKKGFKPEWLTVTVPTLYWSQGVAVKADDILVVPEVMVNMKEIKKLKCRKLLFVQASSFLFEMLPEDETHLSLGFEGAIGIMPHMMPIIEKFAKLKTYLVPPFVAEYFLKEGEMHEREKAIIIFPKFHQQDFGIVRRLLQDKVDAVNPSGLTSVFKTKWKLIVMKNKSHKQVAELMKTASFFIATNTFESFNASVVEAMAAGCISICYEGFGPRDYIRNGENAFVFPNNEAYQLVNKVYELIDTYEHQQEYLRVVRENGYKVAQSYNYEATKERLIDIFKKHLAAA